MRKECQDCIKEDLKNSHSTGSVIGCYYCDIFQKYSKK